MLARAIFMTDGCFAACVALAISKSCSSRTEGIHIQNIQETLSNNTPESLTATFILHPQPQHMDKIAPKSSGMGRRKPAPKLYEFLIK